MRTKLPSFIITLRSLFIIRGMTIEEFDTYGATVRTLRGFIASYYELIALIREQFILPNPDVRPQG